MDILACPLGVHINGVSLYYEISESKISFLDLFLFKGDGCATLHYSTFQKPRNKFLRLGF